ncbi:MAG: hypothetical protein ABJG47_16745 [Ekhidna sp.]
MRKIQLAHKVIMVIGIISILFSAYSAFTGRPFDDYFFGLLIGAILLGTAYNNDKKWKQHEDEK